MKNKSLCDLFTPLLIDSLNGKLGEQDQVALTQHIQTCASCAEELQQMCFISQFLKKQSEDTKIQPSETKNWQALLIRIANPAITTAAFSFLYHPVKPSTRPSWRRVLGMIRMQLQMVSRDLLILPLILLIFVLGYCLTVSFTSQPSLRESHLITGGFALLAPFLIASCMAFLFSPDEILFHDMSRVSNTPIILLVFLRFMLVILYSVGITAGSALFLLLVEPTRSLHWALTDVLAPLCGLTALTLLITSLTSSLAALGCSCVLWLLRVISYLPQEQYLKHFYEPYWHQTSLLFTCAIVACLLALFVLKRRFDRKTPHPGFA
jgi:hypothetical protein